ncbi:MAG: RluA family pseudouridine synthase [Pseudomonadota bacterium]
MIDSADIPFFTHRWPVLYEDNHLLGLYKPAGLLVQGDRTGDPCLLDLGKSWLKARYAKPGQVFLGLVHRLDRPVAGVVLFARTSKAAARLSAQFRERRVTKDYLAVVHGRLETESGELAHHLVRDGASSRVAEPDSDGAQAARLTYRRLGESFDRSLVAVSLHTGRRHQIRAQLAAIGHPILGDLRYGAPAPLPNAQIALLARHLGVTHPTTKAPILLNAPIPAGWPWSGPEAIGQNIPWTWREMEKSMRIPIL